jgi:hypothetical protein
MKPTLKKDKQAQRRNSMLIAGTLILFLLTGLVWIHFTVSVQADTYPAIKKINYISAPQKASTTLTP